MIKLKLNKKSQRPLFEQLREGIAQAIEAGTLLPGERLPSVATMGKQLHVTQSTVLRAFAELAQVGLLESKVGRGTFVRAAADLNSKDEKTQNGQLDPDFILAVRRLRMGVAQSLEALQGLTQRPGVIAFTAGVPDPRIASDGILAKIGRDVLKRDQVEFQGYGHPVGMPELREAIARHYDPSGRTSADQVLVTSGSQQAISLLAQYALEQRLRVICEVPCYMGVPNAFGAIGHWVESLPRDKDGPMLDRLGRFYDNRRSLLYLCPQIHNPMGTDLHPQRLAAIAHWAKAQDGIILADEIFRELRMDGPPAPSLVEVCGAERTIVVGSLSKAFMCGLRIGWLIATPERIRTLMTLKRAMDISCPPLIQSLAASFMSSDSFEEHMQRAREHYRLRRDAVLENLQRCMPPGVTWTSPQGGFHLWVELPAGYSSIALFMLAIERNVAIAPGPQMDIDHRFVNGFRLSYGSLDPATIQKGIELLADAVKKLLASPPADTGLSGLGNFL